MCAAYSVSIALYISSRNLFTACRITIDHPSDRGIPRKEFSKLTQIKCLFEIINPAISPK